MLIFSFFSRAPISQSSYLFGTLACSYFFLIKRKTKGIDKYEQSENKRYSARSRMVQESLAMQSVSGEAVGMAVMVLKFKIIERRIFKLKTLRGGHVRLKD